MCLQYLLSAALPPGDAWLRKEFDILWRASAIASELCLQLAKQLQLPDAASMATQLVLSSLGRFAVTTLMRRAAGAAIDPAVTQLDMVQRALAEQEKLGLSAGETGYLLMQDWGLPASMVAETRDIGRILFAATPTPDAARSTRLALCCLCAGLAERMARGTLTDLLAYDPASDVGEDHATLRAHLDATMLTQLADVLRTPEMRRMLA